MADEKPRISDRILAYLAENPKAQDTLEGIVEWWLLERLTKNYATKVKEALVKLAFENLVLERRGKDSRTYYKINRRKLREISAFLKEKN
ncbi:MAG TPA: hypothetical protein VHE60_10465 [Pyrinomonadaceae bacterium]|nr:hypothetical protein [Pyrinomonadaceae bacterium]